MDLFQENIFVVGPQASGMSFIGREQDIKDLETSIFAGVGAVHLVGPTRIGKSSIVSYVFDKNREYPNRICVQMSMGESLDAYDFWKTLAIEIREQIRDHEFWNKTFERLYKELEDNVDSSSKEWFADYRGPLKNILKQIQKSGFRLVLGLDEFDSVERLFGQESHYFQLLRSIYSEPMCATSGVIVSRRRLQLFEAQCKDVSTYHGVFREKTLYAFSDKDMDAFYDTLSLYNIRLSPGAKKKFSQYTGRLPYLCCMFAERMVSHHAGGENLSDKDVVVIFKECLPQVDRYYEDLIDRLEADNYTEIVFYLSIGSKIPNVTKRHIDNLTTMGVLVPEEKGDSIQYYAYSKDFMTYFRTRTLKLPIWETMTLSEKKIKTIFKKEYPLLDDITYEKLLSESGDAIMRKIDREYPEIGLNWRQIKGYCEDLAAHKDNPTILDVLTLSKIVGVILDKWTTKFHQYFAGDDSWKLKLEYIKKMRNPMAHAMIDYIDQQELAVCMQYCNEIIHL